MAAVADSVTHSRADLEVEDPHELAILGLVFLALIIPWAILFAALPPTAQNFPINDDWAFAKGAVEFAEGRGIHYQGWSSMPLMGQWLWAWPFLKVFEESHVSLRISTIVLSWLCLIAFYDLLRHGAGLSLRLAAFTTTALGLSPYFLWLSGTYMTDIPALAFSLIALALYARAFRSEELLVVLAAALAATLGAVTRQNTITASAAAAVMLLLCPRLRWNTLWWFFVLMPAVVCLCTHLWLQKRPDAVPRPLTWPTGPVLALFPFIMFHFLGIAALPALVLVPAPWARKWFVPAFLLMAAGAVAVYFASDDWLDVDSGLHFPYPLIWFPEASQVHGFTAPPVAGSEWFRWIMTGLGCLGGGALIIRLPEIVRQGLYRSPILLFSGAQLLLLLVSPVLYDRYLVSLIPGALFLVAACSNHLRLRWNAGIGVLVILAAGGVAIFHDRLAWNSAQWRLGQRALAQGARPEQIEGGLEWDGWYAPKPAKWNPRAEPTRRRVSVRGMCLPFNQMCFPDLLGIYALCYSEIPGARTVDQEPYSQWLPPARRFVYLQQWQPAYNEYRRQILGPEAK
jgi:hypothetical protein